jgi:DNA-binding LytR/AlgR family response regulator
LCDDEPLAIERLRRMLGRVSGVEVAGAFPSGEDLLAAFKGGIDALLLDVEMPRLDGFDVVDALSRRTWSEGDEAPALIFVTAHSEFALEAFDSGAVDFLTKPVRMAKLERAVERARAAVENRQARRRLAEAAEQLSALKAIHSKAADEPHLWVRKGPARMRLDVAKIDWVAAEGECVRFHCGEESFLERQSINAVEQALGPFGFLRIHRSAIVNSSRIGGLARTKWGSLQLRLLDGTELRVSKSFQPAVRRFVQRGVQP